MLGVPAASANTLDLTDAERAWLSDHPVIPVASDFFAPIVIFDDEGGDLSGVAGDYLAAASEMLGVEFELVLRTHRSHRRTMQALENGDVALVSHSMTNNKALSDGWAIATGAYLTFPTVVVTAADAPFVGDFADLAGLDIVGTPPALEELRRHGVGEDGQFVPPDEALTGIATGRWDAFVADLPIVSYFMAQAAITNIKINGELPVLGEVVMVVRAEDAALASSLDKAFAAISPAQKDEIWRRWFRVTFEESVFVSPWLWVGIGCGALLLVGAALLLCRMVRRVGHVQGAVASLDEHVMSARLDADGVVTEATNALCLAVDCDAADIVGPRLSDIARMPEEGAGWADRALSGLGDGSDPWSDEVELRRANGETLWAQAVISPLRRKDETVGYTVIWQDISAHKRFRDLSLIDELTGLGNRRRFNQDGPALLAQTRAEGSLFAIAAIDVDNFKAYNDTYGHAAGDVVLVEVGATLRASLRREQDLAVRLGGEEFAVAFKVSAQPDAVGLAEGIRTGLQARGIPHEQGTDGVVTASLGLVVAGPYDERDLDALLAEADAALYAAKNGGRNRVSLAPGPAPTPLLREAG